MDFPKHLAHLKRYRYGTDDSFDDALGSLTADITTLQTRLAIAQQKEKELQNQLIAFKEKYQPVHGISEGRWMPSLLSGIKCGIKAQLKTLKVF